MEERITQRAYDIFRENGLFGRDMENWLQAEQELFWRPAVELTEKDDSFLLEVALPGFEAKDLDIEVTDEDVLLKAEAVHEHNEDKGTIHFCSFARGKMFHTIHLPRKIDTEKVTTEFRNGMLRLTAGIAAEARAKKISVAAA